MTVTTPTRRTPLAARRIGYIVAGVITAWILFAINVSPGWQVLPFLTPDTDRVLLLVNASIAAGLIANMVYIAHDPAWIRSLGDLVTAVVGLAALGRIWEVFPFDFRDSSFDWATLVRVVLAVAMIGSAVGIVANVVGLMLGANHGRRCLAP